MTSVPESVRLQVRQRANNRCEYCRKPDSVSTVPFHVDHIISRKHGGSSALDNLAWACFECNIAKGTDIASFDHDTKQLASYYNPRQQIWSDHFTTDGPTILGITPSGRVTVRLLLLNSMDSIPTRLDLIAVQLWP